MHVRVRVRVQDGGLRVEALHVAEVEADAHVVAAAAGVLGVRRGRTLLRDEDAREDERLGEGADLLPDLFAERARDEGGIDGGGSGERHARLYLLQ